MIRGNRATAEAGQIANIDTDVGQGSLFVPPGKLLTCLPLAVLRRPCNLPTDYSLASEMTRCLLVEVASPTRSQRASALVLVVAEGPGAVTPLGVRPTQLRGGVHR